MVEKVVVPADTDAQPQIEFPIERRHMATVGHPPGGGRRPLTIDAGVGKGGAEHAKQAAIDR